jgi:hypothetical protein
MIRKQTYAPGFVLEEHQVLTKNAHESRRFLVGEITR